MGLAIEEYPLKGLSLSQVLQVASVLTRVTEPDQPIAVLTQTRFSGLGPSQLQFDPNTGIARGWTIGVVGRSGDGFIFGRLWNGFVEARNLRIVAWEMDEETLHEFYWDEHLYVDPSLEEQLAQHGFPGARAPRPLGGLALVGSTGPRPQSRAPSPAIAPKPEPRAVEPVAAELEGPVIPDLAWESAQTYAAELLDLSVGDTGLLPTMTTTAAPPLRRPFDALTDVFERGWRDEAEAMTLLGLIATEPDSVAGLRVGLASTLPERTKRALCAVAAHLGERRKDPALIEAALEELFARQPTRQGDLVAAYVARAWPLDAVSLVDVLGTVDLGCAAVAASWRMSLLLRRAAPERGELETAMRPIVELRDALLGRAGIAMADADTRVEHAASELLSAAPAKSDAVRFERLRIALQSQVHAAPPIVLRNYALWHSIMLHTIARTGALAIAAAHARAENRRACYGTAGVSPRALVESGRRALAHHHVQEAAWAARDGATDEALELLGRAFDLVPSSIAVRAVFAEARFAAKDWTVELCTDLIRIAAQRPSELAPVAELIAVAGSLGKRSTVRFARRELVRRSRNTPHAWIVDAREIFAARRSVTVDDLSSLITSARPNLDGLRGSRLARALYDGDPELAVEDAHKSLVGQRDALEWALLVRELGDDPPTSEEADTAEDGLADLISRTQTVWPLAARSSQGSALRARAHEILARAGIATALEVSDLHEELAQLLADANASASTVGAAEEDEPEREELAAAFGQETADEDDGFLPMRLDDDALRRSQRELATPAWALAEGAQQVARFNLARGVRDLKMLKGTRDERGAIWELRHRDRRNAVRVLYRLHADGPRVEAIVAKRDDAHQRRVLAQLFGWN